MIPHTIAVKLDISCVLPSAPAFEIDLSAQVIATKPRLAHRVDKRRAERLADMVSCEHPASQIIRVIPTYGT
jgi:hypothetical protein